MGWAGRQVMDVCACTSPLHGALGAGISAPGRPSRPTSPPTARPAFLPDPGRCGARSPRGPTPSGYAGHSAAGRLGRWPPRRRSLAPTPLPPLPWQPTSLHAHPVRELHRGRRTCAATQSRCPAFDEFRAGPRPGATAPPAARRCSAARSGVPALGPAHRWSLSPRAPPPAVLESRLRTQEDWILAGLDLSGLGLGWSPLARGTLKQHKGK